MIVPTVTTISPSHAQISTPASNNVSNDTRSYGPQSSQQQQLNATNAINTTAVEGIKDMRMLLQIPEEDLGRYNLTGLITDMVMKFASIQANLTALQTWADDVNTTATNVVTATQQQLADARAEIAALQTQLEEATEEEDAPEEEEEEPEPEPEAEEEETEEEEDTTTTPQQSIEDLVNNPRTDPEGDGGFPGDIDG